MATRTLLTTAALLSLLLCNCRPTASTKTASPLDYVEFSSGDGWNVRIYGDGSGRLTHRQYPTHHLDYPGRTFDFVTLIPKLGKCRSTSRTTCYQISYYRAVSDRTLNCECSGEEVAELAFATAIAQMQVAVDDGSSERSCRMLGRRWLVAR